jgi:hypothetical protein
MNSLNQSPSRPLPEASSPVTTPAPGLLPLTQAFLTYQSMFPGQEWWKWEPETVVTHPYVDVEEIPAGVNIPFEIDKAYILHVLLSSSDPWEQLSHPEFFLRSVDVSNGRCADFDLLSNATTLELAVGLEDLRQLSLHAAKRSFPYTPGEEIADLCVQAMVDDGWRSVPTFFQFVHDPRFSRELVSEDKNKDVAIRAYVARLPEAVAAGKT